MCKLASFHVLKIEISHDMTKPTKWVCTQRRLRSAWSESSLSAWRKLGSLPTHWANSKDFDLIRLGRCPGWSESLLGAHSLCWFCYVAAQMSCIMRKGIITLCSLISLKCAANQWGQISGSLSEALKLSLNPCNTVWANSEGSGETAWRCRLAWAFAVRISDKYPFLIGWLKCTR